MEVSTSMNSNKIKNKGLFAKGLFFAEMYNEI